MRLGMKTSIIFPPSREKLGKISSVGEINSNYLMEAKCLGRSDNKAAEDAGNPDRDPLKRCGDIPTGEYKVFLYYKSKTVANERMYGKADETGKIPLFALIPISGDALTASKPPNKRAGLAIHAGDENPKYKWWDGLRPTNGCVRVHQATLDTMVKHHKETIGVGYTLPNGKPFPNTHTLTVLQSSEVTIT